MKKLEFFKVFKDPYVLFPLYVLKSILFSFGMIDFWILGLILIFAMFEKFVSKLEIGVNRFFDTKEKIISENQFRAGVNADMSKLLEEVNMLKMITSNKGIFGVKK